jgi:hypothetical protein
MQRKLFMKVAPARIMVLILHEKYKYHSIYLHIRIFPSHPSVRILPSHPSAFYHLIRPSAFYPPIRPSASAFYPNPQQDTLTRNKHVNEEHTNDSKAAII